MHPRTLTLLLALVLAPTPASAETITLQPLRDNTLFSDPAGALSSGAGPHFFVGNNSVSNTRRGVIAFDIASGVPADATIDSVTLRLFASSARILRKEVELGPMFFMPDEWGRAIGDYLAGRRAA